MSKKVVTYAPDVWKCLNGFFCIYKPQNQALKSTLLSLRLKLCKDLNRLETRPPRDYVKIGPLTGPDDPVSLEVVQNYADHPFVIGPRYQKKDIDLEPIKELHQHTSGVYALAIGHGVEDAKAYAASNFLMTYHITGQLGIGCRNYFHTSPLFHKAKYEHVTAAKLDHKISMLQNSWQSMALKQCGMDMSSSVAYELASKGLVRPADPRAGMMVYNIKLLDFKSPYFTLEVHCTQGDCEQLMEMVSNLGLNLKTVAAVTKIRVVRFGHFTLDHALLPHQWNLQDILNNLHTCQSFRNSVAQSPFLEPPSPNKTAANFQKSSEDSTKDVRYLQTHPAAKNPATLLSES